MIEKTKYLALKFGPDYEIKDDYLGSNFKFRDAKLADVINNFVPYVFVITGLILLSVIIMGGFEMLTSAGDPKKAQSGQGKIVSGIVGFLIVFLAYWIAEILGIMLGFDLLAG